MHNIQFVPECYAETEMVKLIFNIKETDVLNHADGIHNVSRILKKEDVENYINIAFIDSDKKNTPFYFDEFEVIADHSLVTFKKHPHTKDYIFSVKPAIEKFLLKQLNEINKDAAVYGLPNDFKKFCKETKSIKIKNNEGYKKMIIDLTFEKTSGIKFIIDKVSEIRNQSLLK